MTAPLEPLPERHRFAWLREPPRPAWIRDHPNAGWFAVSAVCTGAFMSQLNAGIVTGAYPTLGRQFHADLAQTTSVGLSFLLIVVGTLVVFGRIADMFGRKLIYLYGFSVFLIGTVLCALSTSLWFLDLARVVEGLGASMIQANSIAIVTLALLDHQRTKGLGFQSSAQALGLALGPTVGGLILAVASWRWLFIANIPIALIGLAASSLFIPRSRALAPRQRIDWTGAAILFATSCCLLGGLFVASHAGWTSAVAIAMLVLTPIGIASFIYVERRRLRPLIDLTMFASRRFSIGMTAALVAFLCLFGMLFLVPYYGQYGLGQSTASASLDILALPLAIVLSAPIAGRLSAKLGQRLAALVTMATASVAMIAAGFFEPGALGLMACLAVMGVGLGMFIPTNNTVIMATVRREETGVVSALTNMARAVGTSLGLAVTALVFAAGGGGHHAATSTSHGFTIASYVLAAIAAGTALLMLKVPPADPMGD